MIDLTKTGFHRLGRLQITKIIMQKENKLRRFVPTFFFLVYLSDSNFRIDLSGGVKKKITFLLRSRSNSFTDYFRLGYLESLEASACDYSIRSTTKLKREEC